MPFKIRIIFLLFFVSISCKKEEAILLTFESFSEEYKGNCTSDDCANVTIDYIKLLGEKEVIDKINFTIGNSIIYFLNSTSEKRIKATTVSEAANMFIKGYENDKKEFPELSPYEAEISISKSLITSKIISVKTEHYTFTGGAHGNSSTSFLNFDPLTGTLITTRSLLKNKKEFTDFVEVIFRKEKNIAENESINSTGFWFENDTFRLPETIGFSDKNVIFIYNQYEIASYADGAIELIIPLEKARPYLTF